MGHIITKLAEGKYNDIPIIFDEEIPPSAESEGVYSSVQAILSKAPDVYRCIENYKGCSEECRKAMMDSEFETEAFNALIVAVDSVKVMYDFTHQVGAAFKDLIKAIQPEHHAAAVDDATKLPQALIVQLCKLLEFAWGFDSCRMMRPNLCNDFSYYRRWLPKYKDNPNVRIDDDTSGRMQMFTGQVNPMMSILIIEMNNLKNQDDEACAPLALLANSCYKMIKLKALPDSETTLRLCASAMTNAVVLFDHVDDNGAFRRSPINVKGIITVVKNQLPQDLSNMLLNSLKYSTKNVNEASDSIQNLLGL